MNFVSLDGNTLCFHGFPKLCKTVSILYTRKDAPAIIADGNNRSSITSFELCNERKCESPQIVDYFVKKGAIGHAFLEVGERYIQSSIVLSPNAK